MQKLKIVSIAKPLKNDCYYTKMDELKKRSSRFADIESINLYGKEVERAHKEGVKKSQDIYEKLFSKEFCKKNIALDPQGEELDSDSFAKLLEDEECVAFFVGGAYGLGESFLKSCQKSVSLSRLTFDHALAALVLSEQIYRALCIINNHPYASK